MLQPTDHERLAYNLKKIRSRKTRKYKIVTGAILAVVLLAATTVFMYRQAVYEPVDSSNTELTSVVIKKGLSVGDLGDQLEEKGLVRNATAFYWYVRLNGLAEDIVFGRFKLSPSMDVPTIVATISDASKSEAVLTVIEGERVVDIDKDLVEMGLIQPGDFEKAVSTFAQDDYGFYPFLDVSSLTTPITTQNGSTITLSYPLEGYLFPDTYFLNPTDFNSTNLAYKLLNNFKKKVTDQENFATQLKNSKRTLHEIITVASVLEKEVRTSEDRAIVAGIIWKRLDSGWRLDADATLLYTKNNYKITTEDLQSDNPYNTRKFKGLPPGPIGNPSLSSINAALNPKKTDYWFYLSAPDGKTVYAKTNDEQNQNKAKYL